MNFLTLTGNLLWEKTLEFADWQAGRTQRARSASFQVGGKGINVSKMLARLGDSTIALSFAGGATGSECRDWLLQRGLRNELFAIKASTRIGVVVRGGAGPETTFLGPDATPDADGLAQCARFLEAAAPGAVLALCGSFPGWDAAEAETLRLACAGWLKRGILVADTYGPPLAWAVQQPLELIKINRVELEALFQTTDIVANLTVPERLKEALARWPAKAWIVTDGPEDVWFASGAEEPAKLSPPRVQEVSPTGSGDVLFACILHARYVLQHSLRDALAFALPYAAANAAHTGVADFDLNNLPSGRSL